ncbi:MAG: hypothetical protein ABJQ55_00010 [Hyphomicrobiales bacterium]
MPSAATAPLTAENINAKPRWLTVLVALLNVPMPGMTFWNRGVR